MFKKTTVKDGGSTVTLYFAKAYAVCLKRAVSAVIVVYDDPDKKTQVRKVYFSTDLTLSGEDIYWVYRSRFGIEFLYRDGKQFTGPGVRATAKNRSSACPRAELSGMRLMAGREVKRSVCLPQEGTPRLEAHTLREAVRWADVFGLNLLVTFPSMGKVTTKKGLPFLAAQSQ